MPIRPFLENRVFGPDETQAMGEAFQIICELLSLKPGSDDPRRRKVAGAIISAATAGIRDAEGLMAAALETLGVPRGSTGEKRPH